MQLSGKSVSQLESGSCIDWAASRGNDNSLKCSANVNFTSRGKAQPDRKPEKACAEGDSGSSVGTANCDSRLAAWTAP